MSNCVVDVRDLFVYSSTGECLVEGLSIQLKLGQPVTILGETGSGKSLLARAIMGDLPEGLRMTGDIRLFGRNDYQPEEIEALWGRKIGMLPQEPWLSLDPIMRGHKQVSLVETLVNQKSQEDADQTVSARLEEFGLKHDGDKVPDHLSGGMAQRLAYICATAAGANVLIADEPTKGLDANRKSHISRLLQKQSVEGALLTITHDIDVAAALDGELIVMRQGVIVERGDNKEVLNSPKSDYARELIAAHSPDFNLNTVARTNKKLITANQLAKHRGGKELFSKMDINVHEGEIVGLIGDSGTGKSTLADMLLGLVETDQGTIDRAEELVPGKALKLYQDPPAAFPKTIVLKQHLHDLCELHNLNEAEIPQWMKKLRLSMDLLERRPGQVSGGELQRIAIVRALMMRPKLLVADEPTSRLDPIVAKDTLTLLVEHTQKIGCALLLVSHDLDAVRQVCDQVVDIAQYHEHVQNRLHGY